ncbi:MAG: hypothetical protein ABI824_02875 [Acidobacteriota bacterium]
MTMTRYAAPILMATLLAGFALSANAATFDEVKVRFCEDPSRCHLVEKNASLVFDDSASELRVDSLGKPSIFRYQDIERVVFDVTTHMRGGLAPLFGIVGQIVADKGIHDYWLFIQDKKGASTMLEISGKTAGEVILAAHKSLGEKVSQFQAIQGQEIKGKAIVANIKSKQRLSISKTEHPVPSIRPGKALIVVAAPVMGKVDPFQQKLFANKELLAINISGTYSFAYVDPGEYAFLSDGHYNDNGLNLAVEAGKAYYFQQNQVGKNKQTLSLQSPEVVMHEISGLRLAEWKAK